MNSIEFDKFNREGFVSARIALLNRAASHLEWITPKTTTTTTTTSANIEQVPAANSYVSPQVTTEVPTSTSANTEQQVSANTYFTPVAPSSPQMPIAEAPATSVSHVDSLRQEIDSIYDQSPDSEANNRMGDY